MERIRRQVTAPTTKLVGFPSVKEAHVFKRVRRLCLAIRLLGRLVKRPNVVYEWDLAGISADAAVVKFADTFRPFFPVGIGTVALNELFEVVEFDALGHATVKRPVAIEISSHIMAKLW